MEYEKIQQSKITLTKSNLIDDRYLNIKEYVKNYNTLLIKSDTGTGKTTSTAEYFATLSNIRIISIVSRKTLADQQVKTFRDKGIVLKDYRQSFDTTDNVVIQLDSILKLQYDDFSNCVIYLDEVNSTYSIYDR